MTVELYQLVLGKEIQAWWKNLRMCFKRELRLTEECDIW